MNLLLIVIVMSSFQLIVTGNEGNPPNENCETNGREWGCKDGFCWSACKIIGLGLGEWCYTTKGHTLDFKYVPCTVENFRTTCSTCWKCAGTCSIFRKDWHLPKKPNSTEKVTPAD